jgi:hypothetical protein
VRLPSDFGRTLVVFPNKSLDLKLTMNAGYGVKSAAPESLVAET